MRTIAPEHPTKKLWDIIVLVVTVFAALEVPLRLSFGLPLAGAALVVDWVVTAIFGLDIALRFVTAVDYRGELIVDRKEIRRIYMERWFAVDLIATIPFDIVVAAAFPASETMVRTFGLLRLARCFRLARVAQFIHHMQDSRIANPGLMRMGVFLFWVGVIAHWVSCGWIALGAVDPDLDVITTYIHALYWTITTLTTVGYGDITPVGNAQMIFSMVVEVLGVGVYAYIIGNIANLVANLDIQKVAHIKRMERLSSYMKYREIPAELSKKVRAYHTHVWERGFAEIDHELVNELPPTLRAEISLHLNQSVIKRVPLFADAEERLIVELGLAMRRAVYMPGDPIVRRGDTGDSMFFVADGELDVLGPDEATIIARLGAGDFFGEMALLSRQPRNATVIACGYCHLHVIDAKAFDRILKQFPSFAAHTQATAAARSANAAEPPSQKSA